MSSTLARGFPDLIVANPSRARRQGRVLIDWGQNDHHKTIVAPYSLRAVDPPMVSAPLRWEEVDRADQVADAAPLVMSPQQMLARLQREGDLMEAARTVRQALPDAAASRRGR